MPIIEIIILAVVQALTEFLPVSSSGHLIIFQELFDIRSNIGIDVMLHFGTLIALIVYFWSDLAKIAKDLVTKQSSGLAMLLIVGTIPAVVIGGLFSDFIEDSLRSTVVVMVMLVVVGIAMIFEKRIATKKTLTIERLSLKHAFIIGLWQCLAFVPGTSRSGITMLAGRSIGLDINKAARFSFLLGIPVIFGATVRILLDSETRIYLENNLTNTIIGVVTSAVLGYIAIALLLKIVRKWGLAPFGWYRIVLSGVLAILLLTT